MGPRGKGVAKQGHSPNDSQSSSPRQVAQSWCSATWYKKGSEGKREGSVVPRSWVSKSLSTIKWPPTDVNYKNTIKDCTAPPHGEDSPKWTVYKLISSSRSMDSYDEALKLGTDEECQIGCNEDDADLDDISGADAVVHSTTTQQRMGKGKRKAKKNPRYEEYASGTNLDYNTQDDDNDDDDENESDVFKVCLYMYVCVCM